MKTLRYVLLPVIVLAGCSKDVEIDFAFPAITFSISDGEIDVPRDVTITITSNERLFGSEGDPLTNNDLLALITFNENNENGPDVDFNAAIDADGLIIELSPADLLKIGQTYFFRLSPVADEHGNLTPEFSISFTSETLDLTPLLAKWSVTSATISSFDAGNNLIDEVNRTFEINRYTFDFEGDRFAGSFRLTDVEEAFWLFGNYTTDAVDSTIFVTVNASAKDLFEEISIRVRSLSEATAEFVVEIEFPDGNPTEKEVQNLLLSKNTAEVPEISFEDMEGEWSVTRLSETTFNRDGSGDLTFLGNYEMEDIPHDRITFTFSESESVIIDTYFKGDWYSGLFEVFDGSNFLFGTGFPGERFIHLASRPGLTEMVIEVTEYQDPNDGTQPLILKTEFALVKNDGTEFETTLDEIVAKWLIKETISWEDGVDVTDPNDPDSGVGGFITFREDLTGTFESGSSMENLAFELIDGNSMEFFILTPDDQFQILFHITTLQVDNTTNEFRLIAGRVEEENDCETDCKLVRFEMEFVLEKQIE